MGWKQALIRAISAEKAADKVAEQAEEDRRQTWWDTTWALAAAPRTEWSEAQDEYVKRTGHSAATAKSRRTTGERLAESSLGATLPQARFAREASTWIGAKHDADKVAEAVQMLAKAEADDMSVREFRQWITGKSWTATPENLTEADEDAIVEKVARTRPKAISKQVRKPAVARQVAKDHDARRTIHSEAVDIDRGHYAEQREKRQLKRQAQQDQFDAAHGELVRAIDGEHPGEAHMQMALSWARKAVKEREQIQPTENQMARMDMQSDEMFVLIQAFKGVSLVSDEELQQLLADG